MLITLVPLITRLGVLTGAVVVLATPVNSLVTGPTLLPNAKEAGSNWPAPEITIPSALPSFTVMAPVPVCALLMTNLPAVTVVVPE